MNGETAAMIAGYIDSDGSIYACGKYGIAVKLGQTDYDFVKALSEYGGTVFLEEFPKEPNRNPVYFWVLTKQELQRIFLERTLPYYTLKSDQAKLALEIVKEQQSKKDGWQQRCRRLQNEITKLNREKPKATNIKNWSGRIDDGKLRRKDN